MSALDSDQSSIANISETAEDMESNLIRIGPLSQDRRDREPTTTYDKAKEIIRGGREVNDEWDDDTFVTSKSHGGCVSIATDIPRYPIEQLSAHSKNPQDDMTGCLRTGDLQGVSIIPGM